MASLGGGAGARRGAARARGRGRGRGRGRDGRRRARGADAGCCWATVPEPLTSRRSPAQVSVPVPAAQRGAASRCGGQGMRGPGFPCRGSAGPRRKWSGGGNRGRLPPFWARRGGVGREGGGGGPGAPGCGHGGDGDALTGMGDGGDGGTRAGGTRDSGWGSWGRGMR